MKDRLIPCVNYICAGETCLKGVKEVTMSKCQHCQKYQPRKTKNKKGICKNKDYKVTYIEKSVYP